MISYCFLSLCSGLYCTLLQRNSLSMLNVAGIGMGDGSDLILQIILGGDLIYEARFGIGTNCEVRNCDVRETLLSVNALRLTSLVCRCTQQELNTLC